MTTHSNARSRPPNLRPTGICGTCGHRKEERMQDFNYCLRYKCMVLSWETCDAWAPEVEKKSDSPM